jgi:Fe-S cluster assembly protein SufD
MITESRETTRFIRSFDEVFESARKNSPAWLKDARARARQDLLARGLPTTKDEDWKYTSLNAVRKETYSCEPADAAPLRAPAELGSYLDGDPARVVFYNGHFSAALSEFSALPGGVTVRTMAETLRGAARPLEESWACFQGAGETPFQNLNKALFTGGVCVTVAEGAVIAPFIHIVHVSGPGKVPFLTAPRALIRLEKSSEAVVIESHVAFDDNAVYLDCPATDIILEENATLRYICAQKTSDRAFSINSTRVWCERNSVLNALTVTGKGALVRNNLDVVLNGEGVDATLNGIYSVYASQHVDNHTSVDHRFPNCASNQLYKGILNGSSRAVFNGKIFVRPAAQRTSSYQLNKNLLLGKDCVVNTKPQLEIFADDVKCTHGATIGQLNEDELFYLQTRGISRSAAVKTLARGFGEELLNLPPEEELRRKLRFVLEPSFARF